MSNPSNKNDIQEDDAFQKFLIKRALDADAPLCKGQMCEEYKETTGSKLSWRDLKEHLEAILAQNEKNSNENDIEEFAKLCFVTSTPINDVFLKRLREHNSVTIDNKRRIIKFEGKKLKFVGIHSRSARSDRYKRYRKKWATSSRDSSADSSYSDSSSLSTSSSNSKEDLVVAQQSSVTGKAGFTRAESIAEFFASKSNEKREEPRDCQAAASSSESVPAVVTIESDTESGFSEDRVPSKDVEEEEESESDSDDSIDSENAKLLQFLAEKSKNADAPFILYTFFDEFVEKFQSIYSSGSIQARFRRELAPDIHEMEEYDVETRVRMLFVTSTPVDRSFLKELRKEAYVELDNHDRIIKYTSKKRGGLRLEGGHSNAAKRRSSEMRAHEESEDSESEDDEIFQKEVSTKKRRRIERKQKRRRIVFSSDEDEEGEEEEREEREVNSSSEIATAQENSIIPELEFDRMVPEAPEPQEVPVTADPSSFLPDNAPKTSLSAAIQSDQTLPNTMEMTNMLSSLISNHNNNFSDLATTVSDSMAVPHSYSLIPSDATSSHFDMRSLPMSQFSGAPFLSIETKRLKDVLKLLKILVISLETPLLNDLNEQIKQMIEKMGDRDEEIQTRDIQSILEVSLFGVTRKFRRPTYSLFSLPTKNAREFLKIFKCMIYGLESTSLYDLLCKVQQTTDNLEADDQVITISDINQVIQNILFTLSH